MQLVSLALAHTPRKRKNKKLDYASMIDAPMTQPKPPKRILKEHFKSKNKPAATFEYEAPLKRQKIGLGALTFAASHLSEEDLSEKAPLERKESRDALIESMLSQITEPKLPLEQPTVEAFASSDPCEQSAQSNRYMNS